MAKENRPPEVPYIVHESAMCRMERIIRRLWVLSIVMFLAFVISNCVWMYYESRYDTETTTQTVTQEAETNTGDAIISDGVRLTNGEG